MTVTTFRGENLRLDQFACRVLVMTSSLFIRGWQNERRTSFAMSKPAATAVIAFVTLLARLTLLPGVDAQFYQVRRDTPPHLALRPTSRHLETFGRRHLLSSVSDPALPAFNSPETSSRRARSPSRSMSRGHRASATSPCPNSTTLATRTARNGLLSSRRSTAGAPRGARTTRRSPSTCHPCAPRW